MIALILFSIASLIIAAFSSWLGAFVGLWHYRRLPVDANWTERARLTYPVRVAATVTVIFVIAISALVVSIIDDGPLRLLRILCVGGFAFAGSVFVASRVTRRILGPEIRWENRIQWVAARLMTLGSFLSVLIVAPILLPDAFNERAMIILAVALIVLIAGSCGCGLWALRWAGVLKPASPRLAAIASGAVQRAGVNQCSAFELKTSVANAFAFPILKWVIFTGRALDVLTDAQVSAVFGHELAHVDESWPVSILRVFSSVQFVFMIVLVRPVIGEFAIPGFAVLMVLTILAFIIARRIMRRMEERADKAGKSCEEEKGAYASALEKLYEVNLIPAVMSTNRRVHPHLYDRIIAAGITPSFPRPGPPPRLPKLLAIATATTAAALMYALVFTLLPR